MSPRWIIGCCRVLLAVVFFLASLHKILFPETFALAVYQYQILPDAWINLIAITLPWIELVAAIAILAPPSYKDAAAFLMLILLGIFALAMSFNILRGLDITCGCFSTGDNADPIGWGNVTRNLGYMFLCIAVMGQEWITKRLALMTGKNTNTG